MTSTTAFDEAGFLLIDHVIAPARCEQLCREVEFASSSQAGSRTLLDHRLCRELVPLLREHPQIQPLLPANPVAVQCTLFDKTAVTNWLVSLHQDLSIPVEGRVESPQCTAWSQKEGRWFVQPPSNVLAQLVAVRVHLDPSTPENGPLRVVPGSHRFGRLTDADVGLRRQELGEVSIHGPRGSALAMRPLLLHASSKAAVPTARRVLHFLIGPAELPFGLAWADTA